MTNPTKRRSSYKLTFMDRYGPDGGLRIKAFAYGLMVFGLTMGAAFLVSAQTGVDVLRPGALASLLAGAIVAGAFTTFGTYRLGSAAGDVAEFFTAGGSSTPYEDQFSEEQARVMQSDYAGAAALFEHRIALGKEKPDPRVLLAAADLYGTHAANHTRAAELYRDVQRLPGATPGQDVYASNKLADLYLGPLKQPGRALVEFRRLIQRYPNSRTAEQARMALANLKPDLVRDNEAAN